MKKFDIILWDLDDTLLDFAKSESHAIKTCFEHFDLSIQEGMIERYSEINLWHWKKFEKNELGKMDVLHGRFRALFEEYGIKGLSPEEFQLLYQEELGGTYFYNDQSLDLCKKLAKEFDQYIVTNGIIITQTKKLRLSGFDQIMNGIYISELVGYQKPQKEFFEACFEQIKTTDRDKIIIIGDSLTSDMKGGNNAGITTCWYNPKRKKNTEEVRIDYEIDSLGQIENILYFN